MFWQHRLFRLTILRCEQQPLRLAVLNLPQDRYISITTKWSHMLCTDTHFSILFSLLIVCVTPSYLQWSHKLYGDNPELLMSLNLVYKSEKCGRADFGWSNITGAKRFTAYGKFTSLRHVSTFISIAPIVMKKIHFNH